MHHQTRISMNTPADFFDEVPDFKAGLGNIKDMFSKVICTQLLYIHTSLIAFILVVMSAGLMF